MVVYLVLASSRHSTPEPQIGCGTDPTCSTNRMYVSAFRNRTPEEKGPCSARRPFSEKKGGLTKTDSQIGVQGREPSTRDPRKWNHVGGPKALDLTAIGVSIKVGHPYDRFLMFKWVLLAQSMALSGLETQDPENVHKTLP